ncbi:MAG: C40 family peptidase, partial [Acidimicrobiales bacterium]
MPSPPNLLSPLVTGVASAQSLLHQALALTQEAQQEAPLVADVTKAQAAMDTDAVTAAQADKVAQGMTTQADAAAARAVTAESAFNELALPLESTLIAQYMGEQVTLPNMVGPNQADDLALAAFYADVILSPGGIIDTRHQDELVAQASLAARQALQDKGDAAAAKAQAALSAETDQVHSLESRLAVTNTGSAAQLVEGRALLADQAGAELTSPTAFQARQQSGIPSPPSTTAIALDWAFSELGKPYLWGGTGPGAFDCSGFTEYVWGKAGVSIPRTSETQYSWTISVDLSQLLPGDLVFYGTTDIHHVGIYIGDGLMIDAPHTGTVLQVNTIWWSDLAGFGRVHVPTVAGGERPPPSSKAPVTAEVVAAAGKVPSETAPPPAGGKVASASMPSATATT